MTDSLVFVRDSIAQYLLHLALVAGVSVLFSLVLVRRERERAALVETLRATQQALTNQTREQQQIFERMLNGFALHEIICDEQGKPVDYRFLQVNPAFEQLTGLRAENIIGKTARQVLPGLEAHWIETYGRVALTGEPAYFENYSAPLERYYQVSAFSPEHGRFVVLFIDVTERRRAEDAIREREERFRRVFDQGPVGIALTDKNTRFAEVNAALCAILGYDAAELRGHSFVEIMHPDEIETNLALWAQLMHAEISDYRQELCYLRKDGALLWISQISTAIRDRDGNVLYMLLMLQDISAQKQFLQDLQQNEERFRAISDLTSDYAFSYEITLEGRFKREWSFGPLTRITGYTEEELDARGGWPALIHPDDSSPVGKSADCTLQRQTDTAEYRILTRTNEIRWVREYVRPMWDEQQQRVVRFFGAIQDITERKRVEQAEREQRQLAEALRDTAALLNSTLNLEQLIERALDNVERVVPHQAANIMLLEGAVARIVGAHGYGDSQTYAEIANLRFELEHLPTLRRVFATGRPLLIRDTRTDPDWAPFNESEWIRSYVCAPIHLRNAIIGVLNLDSGIPNFFGESAVARLQAFTDQFAVALENARLLQTTQRHAAQLEILYKAGLALNRILDPQTQIESLLANALRAVEGHRADFFVVNHTTQRVEFSRGLGYDAETLQHAQATLGFSFADLHQPSVQALRTQQIIHVPDTRSDPHWISLDPTVRSGIWIPIRQQNTTLGVFAVLADHPQAFSQPDEKLLELLANQAAISLQNAQLFADSQYRATQLEALHRAAVRIQQSLEPLEIYRAACEEMRHLGTFAQVFLRTPDGLKHLHTSMNEPTRQAFENLFGGGPFELVVPEAVFQDALAELERGESILRRSLPVEALARRAPELSSFVQWVTNQSQNSQVLLAPLLRESKLFGILVVIGTTAGASDLVAVALFARQVSAALENARLFAETRRRLQELEALNRISTALRQVSTRQEMAQHVLDTVLEIFDTTTGELLLYDRARDALQATAAAGWFTRAPLEIPADEGIVGRVFSSDQPYLATDLSSDPQVYLKSRDAMQPGWGGAFVPLRASQETIGVIAVAYPTERAWTANEVGLLETIAAVAGNAFARAALHEQTERRVRQLAALRAIDAAITASTDLQLTLDVLLAQTLAQLDMDAADVLTYHPALRTLEYAAGRGFHTNALQHTHLRLGQGYAGTAAMQRKLLVVLDLNSQPNGLAQAPHLKQEHFVTYVGVPLVAQGSLRGVLELFKRAPFQPNAEWLEFVQAIGAQAAISIDNAEMFRTLELKNFELALAYDATIEGWSRALDMRDRETEGHTQRVTELTLQLARAVGIGEDILIQLRRGSLLHDIGKMGIPDSILLKPDKLTPAEWAIMRTHPQLAYELLAPIPYLRGALEIPYCHHERWDGTGYPRGLQGEQIPLAARIFAVVDAWDALRSDRPYRSAWTREQVCAYLREQSGKAFEPRLVEIFLQMV
ncbi:MAG: GAF domain-containing protein [Chloroflexi bacterium]|nr:GAF domain-containing protein [Chloroflexota bacterium]